MTSLFRVLPGAKRLTTLLASLLACSAAAAATITVTDSQGKPLAGVMVTQTLAAPAVRDTSDGGYQQPGRAFPAAPEITGFTDAAGRVTLPPRAAPLRYRLRKPGFVDASLEAAGDAGALRGTMQAETDAFRLAEAKPANVWLGALPLKVSAEAKKHFQMQCGFCHQQGNAPIRVERTPEQWRTIIDRMMRYGSRLPTELQKALPQQLADGYRALRENPSLLGPGPQWDATLAGAEITEWPLGDAMSQTHDMLLAPSGLVYVADNIQDRLYEVDPRTNLVTVYKIPHLPGDAPGGLIAGRLREFPRHDSTSNAHSLAQSARDGHIFITPSAQQRLVEFDPVKKTFTLHEIGGGFYPHTVRIDAQDNVWFTLALSNEVARFERKTATFTRYELPFRSLREKLTVKAMPFLFKLIGWGLPLNNWLPVDYASTGTPLPYGIDITPDGMVWVARLHGQDLARIDPRSGQVTMVPTPFLGPRRLRTDGLGNLWIVAFGDGKLARYSPADGKFTLVDLPVQPLGSETPYSLAVDKKRNVVWVTGNQSNAVHAYDVLKGSWRSFPLPRQTTFTRDFDVAEDGSVYTSNSNFPSWHVEGAQPTLIRIRP